MSNDEIMAALQALVDEHMDTEGTGMDFVVGALHVTLRAPQPLHNPRGPVAIISGAKPDLRAELIAGLQRHIPRLVTRRLIGR